MARKRLLGDTTTIVVLKKTRDILAKFGSKDDTFDDIISRLAQEVESK